MDDDGEVSIYFDTLLLGSCPIKTYIIQEMS